MEGELVDIMALDFQVVVEDGQEELTFHWDVALGPMGGGVSQPRRSQKRPAEAHHSTP